MAGRVAPYIDNTGLVFAYDQANIVRSYLGEPTVNLLYSAGATNLLNGAGDIYGRCTKTDLGNGKYRFVNNGTGVSTVRVYTNQGDLINGATYACSVYYENLIGGVGIDWCDTGITGLNYSTNVSGRLGGYGTRGTYDGPYYFLDINFDSGGAVTLFNPQVEYKSHVTPFVAGTRSVTQGLKDLTSRSTIDLSNVSFDSSAQMTFDGTDDKIHGITAVHSHLSSSAIEFVVTPESTGKKMTVGGYRHNEGYSSPTIGMVYIDSNNKFYASVITAAEVYRFVESVTTIQANRTYHVVFNKDTSAGVMQLYVNGVAEGAQTFNAATYAQWSSAGSYIGSDTIDLGKSFNTNSGQGWSGDFLDGKIHTFKMFSKTLTASEIQQNFNAVRGRYGI